jgi:hypothetical protein
MPAGFASVTPQYTTTVGELAGLVQGFKDSRATLMTERVGTGLVRALYSTYVSYLPPELFAYTVPQHADPRGVFGDAQNARLRPVLLLYRAPRHYPGRPLPPQQDREVFGHQGPGTLQVQAHANRPKHELLTSVATRPKW